MSRKQIFANLIQDGDVAKPDDESVIDVQSTSQRSRRVRPLMGSADLVDSDKATPVGVLGQSLDELGARSKRAAEIEKMLTTGSTVVELETNLVDPSFVPDRMTSDDEAFQSFLASINSEGQHVPILVRPHPKMPGRFEVAFGHRRLRAAVELKRPVKAVVRELSDQELVIAQGQENNERQDLSYIEKARFAQRLERQFPRNVIMAALGVYRSDLSNLIAVASKVPGSVIEAIGPAHGVGRRNWMALADILMSDPKKIELAEATTRTDRFRSLSSQERFHLLAKELKDQRRPKNEETLFSNNGDPIGQVKQTKQKVTLTIDRSIAPDFAEFVLKEVAQRFNERQR